MPIYIRFLIGQNNMTKKSKNDNDKNQKNNKQ